MAIGQPGGMGAVMIGQSQSHMGRPVSYQQLQRDSQSALITQLQRSKQLQQPNGP